MDLNRWNNKRLRVALVAMGLGTVGFFVCHWSPALADLYPGYCMFLLGAAAILTGGETVRKSDSPPEP